MPLKSGSSKKTIGKKMNESFDSAVANFLSKYYTFNVVTEENKCKYATEGCDCDGCADCKANQKK